jgi:RNA polymerase sigma factor (sigma-70 family)
MKVYESEGIYNLQDVLDYHINRYLNKGIDREDLYQQAYLGYLTALKNYDRAWGKMTLLYASKYIMGSLHHYVMKENFIANSKADLNEEAVGTTMQLDKHTSNNIKKHMDKINSILHLLPREESVIIYEYYLRPKTKSLLELARERGVTKQRVHQLKAKGIETIKALLGEQYITDNI